MDITEFFLRKSEYQKAVDILEKSLDVIDQIKDHGKLGLLLNHLGIAYNGLGKYDCALESYFKALKEIEMLDKKHISCSTHINIGNTYTNCNELDKALHQYNEALGIAEEIKDEGLRCTCILNIAGIFFYRKEFKKALNYYFDLKQIYESRGFLADLQDVLSNIGRMYSQLNEHSLAVEYYEKALVISEKLENKYLTANTIRFLAELFLEQKKLDQVEELLFRALRIAEDIKSQNLIRAIYENLAKYYQSTRKYKSALEYREKFFKLSYEVFNEESQKRIEELQVQYETDKKVRETEIYRLKNVELVEANQKLKDALVQVKVLGGLIPICATCKKIRDDKGFWNQLEAYITDHSDASFTHGICPSCAEEVYQKLEGMTKISILDR